MEIISPLTNNKNIEVVKTIDVNEIVSLYQKSFEIDVSLFFKGLKNIFLCKDTSSDYIFFYPKIQANSNFYVEFSKFPWYYMEWKWEFQRALLEVNKNDNILEVGCGKGNFLKYLQNQNHKVTGLEFNEEEVIALQKQGLKAYNIDVEEFANKHFEEFDVVVLFQVLEHIYDVNKFLTSLIKLLKKGGKLIISVPNNDSFIKYSFPSPLNLPPHHSGWWTQCSLFKLAKIYKLQFIDNICEPLQDYHFDWYYDIFKSNIIRKYGPLSKIFFLPFRHKRYRYVLKLLKNQIKGMSIMSIYKKE